MVHSFLIHTILPGDCKILYSYDFSPIFCAVNDNTGTCESADDVRTKRWEVLHQVAREVQSQYSFQSSVSGKSYEEDLQRISNEGTIPTLELGYHRLKNCVDTELDFNSEEKVVTWMAALNCAFVMIMDPLENRLNAECVLKMLIAQLHSRCQVFLRPNEISNKIEIIDHIIEQFVPAGTLLFMNHRVIRQFEKELDSKLKNFQVFAV
jgi:AP-5 complex subunit sigma-1